MLCTLTVVLPQNLFSMPYSYTYLVLVTFCIIALTHFIATSLADFFLLKFLIYFVLEYFLVSHKALFLGAVHFGIFIDGICFVINHSKYIFLVDDKIFSCCHVTGWLQLQLDTDTVQSWCDANLMNPSRSKTRVSLLCLLVIHILLCMPNLLVLS